MRYRTALAFVWALILIILAFDGYMTGNILSMNKQRDQIAAANHKLMRAVLTTNRAIMLASLGIKDERLDYPATPPSEWPAFGSIWMSKDPSIVSVDMRTGRMQPRAPGKTRVCRQWSLTTEYLTTCRTVTVTL